MAQIKPCQVGQAVYGTYVVLFNQHHNTRSKRPRWETTEEIKAQIEKFPPGSVPETKKARRTFERAAGRAFWRLVEKYGISPPGLLPSGEYVGFKEHGGMNLTVVEELILVGLLLSRHHHGVVHSKKRISQTALLLYPDQGKFTNKWANGFLKRNSKYLVVEDAATRKAMSQGRKSEKAYEQTYKFTELFEELLSGLRETGKPVVAETLVNADETLIREGDNHKGRLQIVPNREKTGIERKDTKVRGSFLTFVTASGEVPVVVVCMKSEKSEEKSKGVRRKRKMFVDIQPARSARHPNKPLVSYVFHTSSPTGYLSRDHVTRGLDLFGHWAEQHVDSNSVVLLWDNLSQHHSLEVLDKCRTLGVTPQMLPPNTSHFLQPLDNKVFATLKTSIRSYYREKKADFDSFSIKYPRLLEMCVELAFQKAFMPSVICSSWENVGLWPFDPFLIKERALVWTEGGGSKKFMGGEGGGEEGGMGVKRGKGGKGKEQCGSVCPDSMRDMVVGLVYESANESFRRVEEIVSSDVLFSGVSMKPTQKHLKPRANTPTQLFDKTGGKHESLLRLEEERRALKERKEREVLERKKKMVEAKRKRMENQEEKEREREEREKRRKEKSEERERERKEAERERKEKKENREKNQCQWEPTEKGERECGWFYDPEKAKASLWFCCECGDYKLCPKHARDDFQILFHQYTCQKANFE